MAKEFYIPVNGFSKKTSKFYAPVNGFSKEIVKAYCSVNGFSKLFYEKGGGGVGKDKLQWSENYIPNNTNLYDLTYLDLETAFRYFEQECYYLNEPIIDVKEQYTGGEEVKFFDSWQRMHNEIDNIISYVRNKMTNENRIYMRLGWYYSNNNNYNFGYEFIIDNTDLTNRRMTESVNLGYKTLRVYPSNQKAGCKRLTAYIQAPSTTVQYWEDTATIAQISIGENPYYNSSYRFPLVLTMDNVGVDIVKSGIEGYRGWWNFKQSLEDKVNSQFVTLVNSPTRDANGISISASNQYVSMSYLNNAQLIYGRSITKNITELDVSDMDLQDSANRDCFLMTQYVSETRLCGLAYSQANGKWGVRRKYDSSIDSWELTNITDKDYFKNSTIKWVEEIDSSNVNRTKIYRNDTLIIQFDTFISTISRLNTQWMFGGKPSAASNNIKLTGLRMSWE